MLYIFQFTLNISQENLLSSEGIGSMKGML